MLTKIAKAKKLEAQIKALLATLGEEDDPENSVVEEEMIEENQPEEKLADFDVENGEDKIAEEISECIEQEKTASVTEPGIEDEINDTSVGGDPTVQEVVDGGEDAKEDIEADADVFPTKCDEVSDVVEKVAPIQAKIARIVKACDEIADQMEACGDLNAALDFDQCADKMQAYLSK